MMSFLRQVRGADEKVFVLEFIREVLVFKWQDDERGSQVFGKEKG